jgi:hypothetical protein
MEIGDWLMKALGYIGANASIKYHAASAASSIDGRRNSPDTETVALFEPDQCGFRGAGQLTPWHKFLKR